MSRIYYAIPHTRGANGVQTENDEKM